MTASPESTRLNQLKVAYWYSQAYRLSRNRLSRKPGCDCQTTTPPFFSCNKTNCPIPEDEHNRETCAIKLPRPQNAPTKRTHPPPCCTRPSTRSMSMRTGLLHQSAPRPPPITPRKNAGFVVIVRSKAVAHLTEAPVQCPRVSERIRRIQSCSTDGC